jgi:predicted nucleotidyltransferase
VEADKERAVADAARALDAAGVAYALIGGVAVGIHSGEIRATVDVDIAALFAAGRERAVTALVRAGFSRTGDFPHSVNFRHSTGEPVQLAFDPSFDELILRAETIEAAGTQIRIVRKQDLIAMKERAAADPSRRESKRHQDRADIARLRGDIAGPDEGW